MKTERMNWAVDDVAKAVYARYKGLVYRDIAKLFGVTTSSISSKLWRFDHPEGLNKTEQDLYKKAGQLEYRVRSGEAPDQRAMWDRQIKDINGITYKYPQEIITSITPPSIESESTPVSELETIIEVKANIELLKQLISIIK